MSADMNVIVFDGELLTVEEVMSYNRGIDIDQFLSLPPEEAAELQKTHDELFEKMYMILEDDENPDNPSRLKYLEDNCWIGQVSTLKAMLSDDDSNEYIPTVVQHFTNIYERESGVLLLTETVINELLAGFDLPSNSIYEQDNENRGIARKEEVQLFLNKHLGSWTFVDNW